MSIVRDLPGIRVVRPLGRDPHRETWLVRLEGDEPGPAVLVRASDDQGARLVRVEAAALHRGRGAGVVSFIDVVDDPGGAAVLRAHCAGPRLATLLAEREQWQAGEVVAGLQPVSEAVARLHRSGVAHGSLTAAEVVVTDAGGVLVDLGHAELFEPDSPEAVLVRIAAVGRDRDAMRSLAVELLRRVAGSRSRAAHALADRAEEVPTVELLDVLVSGLADLAAPVPIGTREPASVTSSHVQQATRLMPVVRAADGEATPAESAAAPTRLASVIAGLRSARARFDTLPAARRRLAVAGGAAVTAAAVLLALPTASHEAGPRSAREPRVPGSAETSTTPTPVPVHEGSTAADAVIAGHDPLAATVALLERRDVCFSELSLLCLENVDQQGSAALTADRTAMQALRDGGEAQYAAVTAVDARLVERLGDSVLVEVGPETAPASLLLMRSEAGWRIRDWVASDGTD